MKKKGNKVIPISFADCDNRNIEALFKKEKKHGCGESSCYYSSAMYMSDNGYREMEKNKRCPKGSIQRELRCKGSLVWCAGD